MSAKFNSFPWHDAELREVLIDRSQKDNIKIIIQWPEDLGAGVVCIEFFNCYAFQSDMNFGIVPPDFILEAECITESYNLNIIRKKWSDMGVELEDLKCFRIVTNSTNSTINIFALGFRILGANSSSIQFT